MDNRIEKSTLLILCILGGWFGLHHFVRKKYGMGVLYLFTAGLFYVGWIIDIIKIARADPINDVDMFSTVNGNEKYEDKTIQQDIELENYRKSKTIKKVMIVGSSSRKKASSSIIRGAVGGAVLGSAGMVGGAVSGKNKTTTTFIIEYEDGHRETKDVKNNSAEFKKLCNFVKID